MHTKTQRTLIATLFAIAGLGVYQAAAYPTSASAARSMTCCNLGAEDYGCVDEDGACAGSEICNEELSPAQKCVVRFTGSCGWESCAPVD